MPSERVALAEVFGIPADEFMRRVQSRIKMLENARKAEDRHDRDAGEDVLKVARGNER